MPQRLIPLDAVWGALETEDIVLVRTLGEGIPTKSLLYRQFLSDALHWLLLLRRCGKPLCRHVSEAPRKIVIRLVGLRVSAELLHPHPQVRVLFETLTVNFQNLVNG